MSKRRARISATGVTGEFGVEPGEEVGGAGDDGEGHDFGEFVRMGGFEAETDLLEEVT